MPRNFSRFALLVGAAFLAAAPALHAQQTGAPVRGDVDGDGRVTAADARIVSDYLVGKAVPAGANVRERGDVNGDGRVTAVDAAIIARAAAGRDVSRFPVGKPVPEGALGVLECTATLGTRALSCGVPGAPGGARSTIYSGPNGTYVKLTTSNIVVDSVQHTFSFTTTVENRLQQPLGVDSATAAENVKGVRVFFGQAPYVSDPYPTSLKATVNNSAGKDIYLGADSVHYYEYSGLDLGLDHILSPGEVSQPHTWIIGWEDGAKVFKFRVYISTSLQYPHGWVNVLPGQGSPYLPAPVDSVLSGETKQLTAKSYSEIGDLGSGPTRWTSSNGAVASVSISGLVTGLALPDSVDVDSTLVTAIDSIPRDTTGTAGYFLRTGNARVRVGNPKSPRTTTITASPTTLAAGDTSLITVTVKDGFGRTNTTGGATVELTTSAGTLTTADSTATTVIANYQGGGIYTAKLTRLTIGNATVTGKLNNFPITDDETVTFNAGAVHHFKVEAAGGGNIPAQAVNTSFNVKVTAQDVHNNTATSFTGPTATVDFTSTPSGITAGAGTSGAFAAGVLSSYSITIGTTGNYTLTATRTGGIESGTSNSFQVQAAPTAVADAPAGNSSPGNPYHGSFNLPFSVDSTGGLLANDTRGFPLATVASFGGGDMGGSVTDHAANGSTVNLPGSGSLAVSADGSLVFTPPTGFTGLYTFQYRLSNPRGTSDAQVTIAVGARPSAVNDSYSPNLLGNVPINTATSTHFRVTTNDAGDAKVLAKVGETHGTATLNSDSTFTFTPEIGYTGPASFTYTVTNGFGTSPAATVSLNVSGIAWFVNTAADGGNDGRYGSAFDDLNTAFSPGGSKPAANQAIFIYTGSYTGGITLLSGQTLVGQGASGTFSSAMGVTWPADAGPEPSVGGTRPTVASGITLFNGVGTGNTLRGFNSTGTITGNNFVTLTTSDAGINNASGQALSLTTGTLSGGFAPLISGGGTNNVLLTNVSTSGTAILGASGNALSGASGDGVVITGGAGSFTFPGNVSNGNASTFAVNVNGKTGGTVTFQGNVSGQGISVTGNSSGSNTIVFSGGSKNINSGTASGVFLNNNTGATIQFTGGGLTIATSTGTPFTATGGGTVQVSTDGGSNNSILASGAAANAVNLSGITLGSGGMNFSSITSNGTTTGSAFSATSVGNTSGSSFSAGSLTVAGAGSRGIDLTSNTAPFTIGGGSVAGTTGDALFVSGGNAAVSVAANLTKTSAGRIASIASHTAGNVTVSGTLSCSGSCTGILANGNSGGTIDFTSATQSLSTGANAAVTLTSNTGATVKFTGGSLTISTGAGAGITATGGGTVAVTGSNNTILANNGGTAVNVASTTIGADGMTFKRIDATGSGTNGIVLSSTGSGAFTVTGDGASDAANTTRGRTTAKSGGGVLALGSGGAISGRSGDGISLNSTGAVTLRNMVITGSASSGDGIEATSVSGLTIDNTRITGHTNNSALFSTSVSAPVILHSEMENNAFGAGAPGADIHNVRLISNTGTGSVQSSVIANTSAGAERQLQIFSTTGTLNITVGNTRISGSTVGDGASVYAYGSSNITASFQSDSIHNNSAFGIDAGTETTQSSSLNITVNNTKFHNNFVGVTVAHGSSGTNTFNITNNNFQNHGSVSININRLGAVSFTGFGLFSGTVSGNTIGTAGVANSGSPLGSNTIDVKTNSNGGTIQVAILNNTIREIGNDGIRVVGRDANVGHTLHARIENNNIANFHASALSGIRGELGAAAGDKITMCLDIENNTVTGAPQNGIRVRSVAGGSPPPQITLTMPAYDGTGATYLANRNPSGGTTSFANGNAGSTTTAGNCTTP